MQKAVNYINQLNNNKKLNISTEYYLSSGAGSCTRKQNILKKTTFTKKQLKMERILLNAKYLGEKNFWETKLLIYKSKKSYLVKNQYCKKYLV